MMQLRRSFKLITSGTHYYHHLIGFESINFNGIIFINRIIKQTNTIKMDNYITLDNFVSSIKKVIPVITRRPLVALNRASPVKRCFVRH